VTGAAIARTAAPLFKKLTLELGGKNPTVVFADADLESISLDRPLGVPPIRARSASAAPGFSSSNRSTIRFLEQFVARCDRFASVIRSCRIRHRAVISAAHRDKILGYIALAKEEAAPS